MAKCSSLVFGPRIFSISSLIWGKHWFLAKALDLKYGGSVCAVASSHSQARASQYHIRPWSFKTRFHQQEHSRSIKHIQTSLSNIAWLPNQTQTLSLMSDSSWGCPMKIAGLKDVNQHQPPVGETSRYMTHHDS